MKKTIKTSIYVTFDGIFLIPKSIISKANFEIDENVKVSEKKSYLIVKKIPRTKITGNNIYLTRILSDGSLYLKNKDWVGNIFVEITIKKKYLKIIKRSEI